MGKIKTQPVRGNQGSRLLDVIAQNPDKRCLKNMGRRMIVGNGPASGFLNRHLNRVSQFHHPVFHLSPVQNQFRNRFYGNG